MKGKCGLITLICFNSLSVYATNSQTNSHGESLLEVTFMVAKVKDVDERNMRGGMFTNAGCLERER